MYFNMIIKKLLHSSIIALTTAGLLCLCIPASKNISYVFADDNIANPQAASINISAVKVSDSDSSDLSASLTDGSYDTTADISKDDYISIESDEPMYGIYILWSSEVCNYTVSYNCINNDSNSNNNSNTSNDNSNNISGNNNNNNNNENTKTIQCGKYGYLHDYIPIEEGTTALTIKTSDDMSVSDIYAYSKGTLPSQVQIWQPPCNNDTDILVFSTHADDEILFLGGVLANYGGEQKLNVQVAYMCNFFLTEPVRQHEELDGLWECGITHYPVKGNFMDQFALDLETSMNQFNYDDIVTYTTECVRRFRPLVCVSQDFNGEYGHGNHRIYAKAVSDAVNNSADSEFNKESVYAYGTWDVPKTYYHLYEENSITLDIDSPLENFNGQSAVDVLKTAFQKHVSQLTSSFNVMKNGYARTYWGNYDIRPFGLYRTTVGYDTDNDMMEHVTYMHTEREAKKEEERLRAAKEQELANTDNQNTDNNNDGTDSQATDNNSRTPDAKQLIITLIAVFIIGVVICAQAYRTRNLYKKKYDENKDSFQK